MRNYVEISTGDVADCLIYMDHIVAVTEDNGHAVVHLINGTQIHLHNQTYKKFADLLKGEA